MTGRVYYNDHEPTACAWLRELMAEGLIPKGEVDDRSILDVRPVDLRGFDTCHFFAGIGGWAYALRLAGWPDDRHVWTGSPPCQPFSVAGAGLADDDPRHLAPHFAGLVRACRPPVLFGEQVASAAVVGRAASPAKRGAGTAPEWAWLDDLFARLEAAGYAVGAADIPAASVGAPHIRQRIFFGAVRLADAERRAAERHGHEMARAAGQDQGRTKERQRVRPDAWHGVATGERPRASDSPWRDADWIACRDGKWRPVEPGTFPLAHGVSGRVGLLRGYGNAIVPQAAAAFVTAFMEAEA